ncbi:MAG: CZB domain-containing protein [Halothiobacillaceae bacterium]
MHQDLLSAQGDIQVFCFAIEGVPYALQVVHVLTISQDDSRLRRIPSPLPGFIGLIDYQGTVVPVLDFAHLLGQKNQAEIKQELSDLLAQRERDHLEWLDALEHSLRHGTPFTKERDPTKCAFGRFYASYKPRDEALRMIWADFDAPHQRIHALANVLLDQAAHGEREAALRQLELERDTTLQTLRRTFAFARDALRTGQHTVYLYLTSDGRTPRLALRLDDISDIRGYAWKDHIPLDAIELPPKAMPKELIRAYLRGDGQHDCLLLEPEHLLKLADQVAQGVQPVVSMSGEGRAGCC